MNHDLVLDENTRTDSCITFLCTVCGIRFVFNKNYVERVYRVKFDAPDTIRPLMSATIVTSVPCQPKT